MPKTRYDDFLEFAIKNEIEAASLYEKYAGECGSPAQRNLLTRLAAMERGHETVLKKIRDGSASSLLGQVTPVDLRVSDFLVETTLTSESTLEEVFIFAMKAEQKAFDLYNALAGLEEDTAAKGLFRSLANEELAHKHDLEGEFEKTFMKEN